MTVYPEEEKASSSGINYDEQIDLEIRRQFASKRQLRKFEGALKLSSKCTPLTGCLTALSILIKLEITFTRREKKAKLDV